MYGQYGTPSYFGTGYQPIYPYQRQNLTPQMQQPQAQSQMQNQQVQPNLPQIQDVRYATEEEAKAFIVYPNASAYFIDLPKNRLYIKSANNTGISNIEYFSLIPINADGTPIKPQEPTPQVDMSDYIKKDELSKYGFVTVEQLNSVLSKLTSQQNQNVGVKNDGTGSSKSKQV